MRQFQTFCRLTILLTVSVVVACSSTPTYNPTTFPYQVNQELLDTESIKTVVIAHVNLNGVTRKYLEKEAPRIDAKVTTYLRKNGFEVLSQREFQQHWNSAERAFGNPVDPTSGKVNMKTFAQIMHSVRDQMAKTSDLDAFIFTDLVELQVSFSGGLKHLAR